MAIRPPRDVPTKMALLDTGGDQHLQDVVRARPGRRNCASPCPIPSGRGRDNRPTEPGGVGWIAAQGLASSWKSSRGPREAGQANDRQGVARVRAVIARIEAQPVGCGHEQIPVGAAHLNPMSEGSKSRIRASEFIGSESSVRFSHRCAPSSTRVRRGAGVRTCASWSLPHPQSPEPPVGLRSGAAGRP